MSRRAWAVDRTHADPHQPDAAAIDPRLKLLEVIEYRCDHGLPVRADGEVNRVLGLTRTVDREGRHPSTKEILFDGIELFLG